MRIVYVIKNITKDCFLMDLSKTGTARWCSDAEDACCFVNKNVALYWLKEYCSKDMEYIIFEAKINVELSNAVIQSNGGQGTMESN